MAEQQANVVSIYDDALRQIKQSAAFADKKIKKSVPKGMTYDWFNNTSFNNVVYAKNKIPDRMLRLIETRNPLIGAITTLVIQQLVEYSEISHDKDVPGWEFVLLDEEATVKGRRIKEKDFLEDFFFNGKIPNYTGYLHHGNSIKDMLTKYGRDRTLIDKICWEVERNRKGEAVALWVIDGASIQPVSPGGFYGSTSQIGIGIGSGFNRLSDEIRKAKLLAVPPLEEIAYVQELFSGGGGVAAAFRETDLIYDLGNELNDIQLYKQGLSVVEKANLAITAFINAMTYNSNGLSRGAIPKIAIAMGKDSGYTQEQLEDAQDEWLANFMSVDGQWNIPLLNSDAKVLNLNNNNREMEYQKFLEFVGSLTCSVCGVDSAELGLRMGQAQNVLSENVDAKQVFSKNRGTRDRLGGFVSIVNKFLRISNWPFAKDWKFKFNGLSTIDKSYEADIRAKNVQNIMTIDEVRESIDLPPLPDGKGEIILNTVYLQNQQMAAQGGGMEQPGQEPGPEDTEDYGGMAEEAMAGLEKAVRLI